MKKLKLWNGRSICIDFYINQLLKIEGRIDFHMYIAAYSVNDIMELVKEFTGKDYSSLTKSELSNYFNAGSWGRNMDGIEPERGIWVVNQSYKADRTPIRLI